MLTRSHKEKMRIVHLIYKVHISFLLFFFFFFFDSTHINLPGAWTTTTTHTCPPRTVYKVGMGIEPETSSLGVRPSTSWVVSQISFQIWAYNWSNYFFSKKKFPPKRPLLWLCSSVFFVYKTFLNSNGFKNINNPSTNYCWFFLQHSLLPSKPSFPLGQCFGRVIPP